MICNHHGLYTQNAINRANNIYLLSEQGYMLLVGFMNTDKEYLNCDNNYQLWTSVKYHLFNKCSK